MNASKFVGLIGLIAVFCAWTYLAITGEPHLPIDTANGSYSNPCCGTFDLQNGQMTVGNQRISYVVERDKSGPYVLPKIYVGVSGSGFVIKPDVYALKLRLDLASPHRIELSDDRTDSPVFLFDRKAENHQ